MGIVRTGRAVALGAAVAGCALAASPPARAESTTRTVRADDALGRLREGNARYVKGRLKHPNEAPKRRAEVATTQRPFAVILSCADSRVPPEIVFDQGLGDLFVVRTAGQAIGDIELASIEYAVEHLGAAFILVLGHERCGAIKATVESLHPPPLRLPSHAAGQAEPPSTEAAHGGGHAEAPEHGGGHSEAPEHADAHEIAPAHAGGHAGGHGAKAAAESEIDSGETEPRDHIHKLVALLEPAVRAVDGQVPPGDLVDAAVVQNVKMLVARLVTDSPLLKSYLVAGRLRIAGARYDLDTGEIKLVR